MGIIIMVSGYKRSGKDFVSTYLAKRLKAKHIAFATALKDIIAISLELSHEELDWLKNEEETVHLSTGVPFTDFRKILQLFGTEAMKKYFGDDVWAELIAKHIDKGVSYVISDHRFPREQEVLTEQCTGHRVISLRVKNGNTSSGEHSSENALDDYDFDYVVDNSAQDESIYSKLDNVIYAISNRGTQ